MIEPKRNHENKKRIIKVLKTNDNQLSLLELKKKSKLANLYFFKALETLEKENIILKYTDHDETWIKMN
jgi:hypothetical protein